MALLAWRAGTLPARMCYNLLLAKTRKSRFNEDTLVDPALRDRRRLQRRESLRPRGLQSRVVAGEMVLRVYQRDLYGP